MLIRSIRAAALAIPVIVLSACASNTRVPTYGLDPGGAELVQQACTNIMGLHAGVAEFYACGDTLAQSVRLLRDADLTARANASCEQQGFTRGSADLAKCVVMSKRTDAHLVSTADTSSPPLTEPVARRTYFSESSTQQDESMELSCAHLGLHPASAGFKQCVVNLKDAMLIATQNPL
jgi:hypothetical protein